MLRQNAPQKKIVPGASQKSKLGLPYSSQLAPTFLAQPSYDCNTLFRCYSRHFNHNMAGQKAPERAGRNMGVRVWIFVGLLVLIFLRASLAWRFAGLTPASFSPTKSPAKRTELQYMVVRTHRMPYHHKSFFAKKPYN